MSLASIFLKFKFFFSICRCEKEGWLYHPSTWGCGTHDCSNAYEKHCQSSKERSVISTRKGAHGSCILIEGKMHHRHIPSPLAPMMISTGSTCILTGKDGSFMAALLETSRILFRLLHSLLQLFPVSVKT